MQKEKLLSILNNHKYQPVEGGSGEYVVDFDLAFDGIANLQPEFTPFKTEDKLEEGGYFIRFLNEGKQDYRAAFWDGKRFLETWNSNWTIYGVVTHYIKIPTNI